MAQLTFAAPSELLKLPDILPDQLGALLKVAVTDLGAIEKDPRYCVRMDRWHNTANNQCLVCLAGAVLAKSFCVSHQQNIDCSWIFNLDLHHGTHWFTRKFMALDNMRDRQLDMALDSLYGSAAADAVRSKHHAALYFVRSSVSHLADYAVAPNLFRSELSSIADTLVQLQI
jgi:hypothetical protein